MHQLIVIFFDVLTNVSAIREVFSSLRLSLIAIIVGKLYLVISVYYEKRDNLPNDSSFLIVVFLSLTLDVDDDDKHAVTSVLSLTCNMFAS